MERKHNNESPEEKFAKAQENLRKVMEEVFALRTTGGHIKFKLRY